MAIDLVEGVKLVPAFNKVILASLVKKGKKGDGERPTDDPGYKETLGLMRALLRYCAASTVDDVQPMTNARLPPPPSVMVDEVQVPDEFSSVAAKHIQSQLGPANLPRVGSLWWQWRKQGSVVSAEWVEMKHDFAERQKRGEKGSKVIFYIHGGAYYLGGLGHASQVQRHARKLKGRCFAPRYRLAPHFPFPCAIQDVLAAYLYLLTIQDPCEIVMAGDSAGGGLVIALLQIIRDQGLPMPAGASLISPWVDLSHSFPSITIPTEFDYVPAFGFHAKPSMSWPPPSDETIKELGIDSDPCPEPYFTVDLDGQEYPLKEQIQMYCTNMQVQIPLVSPICAASLGGLCPVQVISGGGEVLRDEQMYLAHKMANPARYAPCEFTLLRNGNNIADIHAHPPTKVQLLSFDDGCHAQPTLGHTNIAKYQYRSVAQFAAWALATAQRADIEIDDTRSEYEVEFGERVGTMDVARGVIGRAGDPLPPFVNNIIRHRVDRKGALFPLEPESSLRCCNIPSEEIAFPKGAALRGFLDYQAKSDVKYASLIKKIYEQRKLEAAKGYLKFPNGEIPPPSALAGRRVIGAAPEIEKPRGKRGSGVMDMMFTKLEKAPSEEIKKGRAGNPNRKSRIVSYVPPALGPPAYEEDQKGVI